MSELKPCICDQACPVTEDRHWVNCPAHAYYANYLAMTRAIDPCEATREDWDVANAIFIAIRDEGQFPTGRIAKIISDHRIASTRPEPTADFNTWRARLDPNGLLDGYELARAYAEVVAGTVELCAIVAERTAPDQWDDLFPTYRKRIAAAIRSLPTGGESK